MGVRPSMRTVGDAYDNAMAESFFASLECELLDRRSFQTNTEARLDVFTRIEGWYNPRRRLSALGCKSPLNFERIHEEVQKRRNLRHQDVATADVCMYGPRRRWARRPRLSYEPKPAP